MCRWWVCNEKPGNQLPWETKEAAGISAGLCRGIALNAAFLALLQFGNLSAFPDSHPWQDGQRLGEAPTPEHLNPPSFRMNKSGTTHSSAPIAPAQARFCEAADLRSRVERLTGLPASEALRTKN
jgi:hypothetical protein